MHENHWGEQIIKSTIAALTVALVAAGNVYALQFTGTALGTWDSGSVVEQSGNVYWNIANNDHVSGGKARISWGRNGGNVGTSRMRFDGAGSDDAIDNWAGDSDGGAFFLGSLFYHNGVRNAGTGIKGIDLTVAIDIVTPDGIDLGDYVFDLEIKNRDNPMGDYVIGLNPEPVSALFNYGGTTYLFEILGFASSPDGPMLEELFRQEGDNITVNLYGQLKTVSQAVPDGGATLLLLMAGLFGLGFLRKTV